MTADRIEVRKHAEFESLYPDLALPGAYAWLSDRTAAYNDADRIDMRLVREGWPIPGTLLKDYMWRATFYAEWETYETRETP